MIFEVNISKYEQRTLHELAQGGRILPMKDEHGDVIAVDCITRHGGRLADCMLGVVRRFASGRSSAARKAGPTV